MAISVITYGELVFGAEKSLHREKNLHTVHQIKALFPIITIDTDVMDCFGKLKAQRQKTGKSIDDMDLLVAATALCKGMILVTHNTKHFESIPDLHLEDWF